MKATTRNIISIFVVKIVLRVLYMNRVNRQRRL